jgi:3-deoxy-7-phosphoheptulonate synthase
MLQMAVVLTFAGGAGGEGRPHRRPVRQAALRADRDYRGRELPSYRGDNINGMDFTPRSARPIPSGC